MLGGTGEAGVLGGKSSPRRRVRSAMKKGNVCRRRVSFFKFLSEMRDLWVISREPTSWRSHCLGLSPPRVLSPGLYVGE